MVPDMRDDAIQAGGYSRRLRDLAVGEQVRVAGFRDQNPYSDRLIRLGLIPGTLVRLVRRAPLGDPVEIRFRGYALVLRPAEADCLEIIPA